MRTDGQLQKDVIDELLWDPSIKEKEIGVAVKSGVVTLTGSVPSFGERYAKRVAWSAPGVRAVHDKVAVSI